jgi:tetratricopeptide (TPR) repeat protein
MDHYNRARLLAEQGRYDLAMQEAAAYLAEQPNSSQGYSLLSFCHTKKGEHQQAIAQAQQAIGLSPDNDFCHFSLGRAQYYANDLKAAEAAIATALTLDPNDPDYHAQAAMIFHEQRKFDKALASAQAGLRLDPHDSTCRNMQVITLLETNAIAEAEQIVDQALRLTPDSSFAHAAQGWVALHHGRNPQALEAFREALRIKPDSDWARQGMMEALKAKNRFYRWILRYDLWLKGLGGMQRLAIISLLLLVPPLRGLYLLVLLPAIAVKAIAHLMLRFDPYGKLLLNDSETEQRLPLWLVSLAWLVLAGSFAFYRLLPLLVLLAAGGMGYLIWRCCKGKTIAQRLGFGVAAAMLPLWLWIAVSDEARQATPQEAAAGAIAGVMMGAVLGLLVYLLLLLAYQLAQVALGRIRKG